MILRCPRTLFAVLLAIALQGPSPSLAFWNLRRSKKVDTDEIPVEYGLDVSFPIQRSSVSTNYAWLPHNLDPSLPVPPEFKDMPVQPLGNKQAFYDDFLQGCVKAHGAKAHRCIETETDRVKMSIDQPQSMQNFTALGYKKIAAPEKVFKLIKEFWEKNRDKEAMEVWSTGNTYTNNWASPTYMVDVANEKLEGGGGYLQQAIWDAARDTIQKWTGQDLSESSLYGVRVYKEGSVLAPHVDRLPLVSSCIINVDQDVDEPWPLEVFGHDGKATNVTMLPGDMVLYESHSVIHGRPFPLKGRFMANIFIHFEPTGHSARHHEEEEDEEEEEEDEEESEEDYEYEDLPPYIIPGSPEAENYRMRNPSPPRTENEPLAPGSTRAHAAAGDGNLDALQRILGEDKDVVNSQDSNGWTPLHEGVRSGELDIVKYLVASGANVNIKTEGEEGATALWWARYEHGDEHPIFEFLKRIGAVEVGPEL